MTTPRIHPTEIPHAAVRERLEAEVARAGSQRALAREWGVSHVYVNDVLHGRRLPGPDMAQRLGVRVEREIVHRFYLKARTPPFTGTEG